MILKTGPEYILIIYSRDMTEQLKQYVDWALVQYDHCKAEGYSRLLAEWPRFDNYNHFQKFVLLNLTILLVYIVACLLPYLSPFLIYRKLMEFIFDLPPVKNYIFKELEKTQAGMLKGHPEHLMMKNERIPYKPPTTDFGDESEKQVLKGKASGSRYAIESHSKFICNLSSLFAYANPLHAETFPLVKQMELEVVGMTAEFIGLKDEEGKPCGTLTSGGTESILMALYSYREYRMKECGVYRPNLVLCESAHPAAIKASYFFDFQIRLIPYDSNYQMNIKKMKSAIDENTVCVYTSYPNYPFGIADDIDTIAPYCHARGIPVHCDMCLGGFVVPFIKKDWKLPVGVTSVSADAHKYGLAAKGVSVLLFGSEKYRRHQFFITQYWPGGLYGTPGISGSRSGVFIASAWISMMKLGRKGFEENARLLRDTLIKVSNQLVKLGFIIISKDNICVLSFKHSTIPFNAVFIFMKEKGWGFSVNLNPFSFQFSFTPLNCMKSDDMIRDIKECVAFYEKNPFPAKTCSDLAVYGACAQVKDDGKKILMIALLMDTYIDLC